MDSADEIISVLNQMLIKEFEIDPDAVVPDARLREDLDLDSLDAADFVIAIENKWGVRFDEKVARSFRTVGDVHSYVRQIVAEKQAKGSDGPAA